jgi:antitoxin component YwqK of YwqJK toxin-antitoxin module
LVKFIDYYQSGILEREVYYNRHLNVDSAHAYDLNGKRASSEFYDSTNLVKLCYYWNNGNYKIIYNITRTDTVWTDDNSNRMSSRVYFTGYQVNFYEGGKKSEEGALLKGKRTGPWIYYDSTGVIKKTDTLR